ncbi:MAG TPA: type II toxin-antitoxin system VapC family toxin [bacterium]|nr:type II toxin-antitoxin system VapC family toxin [bacterium]HPN45040.1 type II toxin-antitoxin system VapC family toxin [bacterium]
MKAMLDTSTFFMVITNDSRLGAAVRDIYLHPDNDIFISMAVLWELAIKTELGKLQLGEPLADFIRHHIRGNDIKIMNIDLPHILALDQIPASITNPFTRLILSQCICENIPLLGANAEYDNCPVTKIW